jgi:hypothetical protein
VGSDGTDGNNNANIPWGGNNGIWDVSFSTSVYDRGVGSFNFSLLIDGLTSGNTSDVYYEFGFGIPSDYGYTQGANFDGTDEGTANSTAGNWPWLRAQINDYNAGGGPKFYSLKPGAIVPFRVRHGAVAFVEMNPLEWYIYIDRVSRYNNNWAGDTATTLTGGGKWATADFTRGDDAETSLTGKVLMTGYHEDFEAAHKLGWGAPNVEEDGDTIEKVEAHYPMLDVPVSVGFEILKSKADGCGTIIAGGVSIFAEENVNGTNIRIGNYEGNTDSGFSSLVTVGSKGTRPKINNVKVGSAASTTHSFGSQVAGDYHRYTRPNNMNDPSDEGQKGIGEVFSNFVIIDIRDHLVDYGVQMWISDSGEFYSGHGLVFNQDSNTVGTATAYGFKGGSMVLDSDRRLKNSIESLDTEIEALAHMRGVSYQLNDNPRNNSGFAKKLKYGVIAQEVQEHMPHIVDTDNEFLAVDYVQLTAFIPQLYQKIVALEKEIKELKKE